jgi:hypothetical protein
MKQWTTLPGIALILSVAFVASMRAASDDRDVRFEGGIGVDPVIGVTAGPPAAATPNTVRSVAPGGLPWVIRQLSADWSQNGHIHVAGRGLLLAGGNSIGTPGALTSVVAAFFCGPGSTTPAETTPAIPLNAAGNFTFNGTGFSAPPSPCVAPVLLIRASASGPWLAAGIPAAGHED